MVRFQQTCGPVMAKGVEDTAFYRWLRLTSLNEVGGDPAHLGVPAAELHAWCGRQLGDVAGRDDDAVHPRHEAQRGRPGPAGGAVRAARRVGRAGDRVAGRDRSGTGQPALDANTEYLLWQTLVGAWPIDADRLTAYLEKATREAKRHTTWTAPDEAYDDAVRSFAAAGAGRSGDAPRQVAAFVDRLAPACAGQRARARSCCR